MMTADIQANPQAMSATLTLRPGAEVIFGGSVATVTRVYSLSDPDSLVDLCSYPAGVAQFSSGVRHDLNNGWSWPSEISARREQEAEAARTGTDFAPGGWVRFAARRGSSMVSATIELCRAQILRVDPIADDPDRRPDLLVRLFPLLAPTDPSVPDLPLADPSEPRIAHPVNPRDAHSAEQGFAGRYELLSESNLFEVQEEFNPCGAWSDCDWCDSRIRNSAARVVLHVPLRDRREFAICPACLASFEASIATELAIRAESLKTRVIRSPLDPRPAQLAS